ncbi:MAG: FtsX-like permease family protein [Marinilabiliales bacterium]|nr:FtsX-like permease family protein [Marinilabiliales bacterium]
MDFYNQGLVVQGSWDDMKRYFRIDDATTFFVKVKDGQSIDGVRTAHRRPVWQTLPPDPDLQHIHPRAGADPDGPGVQHVRRDGADLHRGRLAGHRQHPDDERHRTHARDRHAARHRHDARMQIIRMVLAEAGLMGVIGGVLGVGTGIVLARILFIGMTTMSGYSLTFVLPPEGIVISLIAAVIISQLAAIFPSRRASKVKILEAVRYE